MSPPLNISKADVDEAIHMLDQALAAVSAPQPAVAGFSS
jgi:4-aminobutyrate aminotransferase-like enzyme